MTVHMVTDGARTERGGGGDGAFRCPLMSGLRFKGLGRPAGGDVLSEPVAFTDRLLKPLSAPFDLDQCRLSLVTASLMSSDDIQ